jgi:hypothetical protein
VIVHMRDWKWGSSFYGTAGPTFLCLDRVTACLWPGLPREPGHKGVRAGSLTRPGVCWLVPPRGIAAAPTLYGVWHAPLTGGARSG